MYRILRTRTCAHEPAHTNSRKLKGDTNLAVKFSGIFVRLICGKMTRNLAENKHLHPTVVPRFASGYCRLPKEKKVNFKFFF